MKFARRRVNANERATMRPATCIYLNRLLNSDAATAADIYMRTGKVDSQHGGFYLRDSCSTILKRLIGLKRYRHQWMNGKWHIICNSKRYVRIIEPRNTVSVDGIGRGSKHSCSIACSSLIADCVWVAEWASGNRNPNKVDTGYTVPV